MGTVSTRFIDMPELVALLALRFDFKEISGTMRTNTDVRLPNRLDADVWRLLLLPILTYLYGPQNFPRTQKRQP